MTDVHVLLSLARIATAALAGTIGVLGFRAWARTRRRNVLAMATGATLLATGYLMEGLLVELAGWSVADATVVESVSTLVAASLLVASLYVRDRRRASARRQGPAEGQPGAQP